MFALGICGCGGKKAEVTGDAAGKVTLGGQPVSGGTINFQSTKTGKGGVAPIGEDGTYSMSDVPIGDYQVLILPPDLPPPKGGPEVKRDISKHPQKYWNESTSDLKAKIVEGDNEFSFDLRP